MATRQRTQEARQKERLTLALLGTLPRQRRRKLDRRDGTTALTALGKYILEGFPVDQELQMHDSAPFMMRMGIPDSVHHLTAGAVEISYCMLFARDSDAKRIPWHQRSVTSSHRGLRSPMGSAVNQTNVSLPSSGGRRPEEKRTVKPT